MDGRDLAHFFYGNTEILTVQKMHLQGGLFFGVGSHDFIFDKQRNFFR